MSNCFFKCWFQAQMCLLITDWTLYELRKKRKPNITEVVDCLDTHYQVNFSSGQIYE